MAQGHAARKKDDGGRGATGRSMGRGSSRSGQPERDEVYGLVSVLYHALQGSETYGKYIRDAETCGDGELTRFFRECQEEENQRAMNARQLLMARLGEGGESWQDEEEER